MRIVEKTLIDVSNEDICYGDFIIPDGVKIIEQRAFQRCDKLKNVSIPSSVEKIASNAFSDCPCIKIINGISYVDNWVIKCDMWVVNAKL